jgi:hypothetical protein
MSILRVSLVLLRSVPPANVRPPSWYEGLFFDLVHGVAAFWHAQSRGQLLIMGSAWDWYDMSGDAPDLIDRAGTLSFAVDIATNRQGRDLSGTDMIVAYCAVPATVEVNGGSFGIAVNQPGPKTGIVGKGGTGLDFWAHEFGHQLGLDHSYGNPAYKNSVWSGLGEYGDPHCVMSAQGYGGRGTPYRPVSPRDGDPEYAVLPPSLNGGSLLGRNWIDAHRHNLKDGVGDFVIERQETWAGAGPLMQAVELSDGNGRTYVVEHRQKIGWDMGLQDPLVIVSAVSGSTADVAHPGTHSATHLGEIRLPVQLGTAQSVFNGSGFGVEVLEILPTAVRVRVGPGPAHSRPVHLTVDQQTLRTENRGTGTETFARGDLLCLEGDWTWSLQDPYEESSYQVSMPDSRQLTVGWTIDGEPAPGPSGDVLVAAKPCTKTDAKLAFKTNARIVRLSYSIETTATGSVLKLRNDPSDGSFEGMVAYHLATDLGTATGSLPYHFEGRTYVYPPAFYEAYGRCLKAEVAGKIIQVKKKLDLKGDDLEKIDRARRPLVGPLLEALAVVREQHGLADYRRALSFARRELKVAVLDPIATSTKPFRVRLGSSAATNDTQFGSVNFDPAADVRPRTRNRAHVTSNRHRR